MRHPVATADLLWVPARVGVAQQAQRVCAGESPIARGAVHRAHLPSAFFLTATTSTGGKPQDSGESRTPSSSSAPTTRPTRPGAHMPVLACHTPLSPHRPAGKVDGPTARQHASLPLARAGTSMYMDAVACRLLDTSPNAAQACGPGVCGQCTLVTATCNHMASLCYNKVSRARSRASVHSSGSISSSPFPPFIACDGRASHTGNAPHFQP